MAHNRLHLFWKEQSALECYRTGVSLHSHTNLSEESLALIPPYTDGVPYLGRAIRRQQESYQKKTGRVFDFERAFWTPPLSPVQAFDLEASQIHTLGLNALVSLSDHDCAEAGFHLQMAREGAHAPISTEWTIPFGPTFFHVGVHNLPANRAHRIMDQLAECTADARPEKLHQTLTWLNEEQSVLIVLNHPFWDEAKTGEIQHSYALGRLMELYGRYFHALELNGLRSWQEQQRVGWLSRGTGLPMISGGDRHGCEANSLINLTNADTFADFVEEIRTEKVSTVMFMPQHREPLRYRVVQTIWDVMRTYPENPKGRQNWSDRVFFRDDDGVARPVSMYWSGNEPAIVKRFSSAIRLVESPHIRAMLRRALAEREPAVVGW